MGHIDRTESRPQNWLLGPVKPEAMMNLHQREEAENIEEGSRTGVTHAVHTQVTDRTDAQSEAERRPPRVVTINPNPIITRFPNHQITPHSKAPQMSEQFSFQTQGRTSERYTARVQQPGAQGLPPARVSHKRVNSSGQREDAVNSGENRTFALGNINPLPSMENPTLNAPRRLSSVTANSSVGT